MRLTSYNVAIKILHAKGCFADLVDRMWTYMEEGDIDRAQCAREKALGMYALIETAKRWKPTIENAKTLTATFSITAGSYTTPLISSKAVVNGIDISGPLSVIGGGNQEVFDKFTDIIDGFLSKNDDILQVSAQEGLSTSILTAVYDESLSPLSISTGLNGFGVTVAVSVSAEADLDTEPLCLTDAQILSVIEKINELCECNC